MKTRVLMTVLVLLSWKVAIGQTDTGDNKGSSIDRIEGATTPGALLIDNASKQGGLVYTDSLRVNAGGELLFGVSDTMATRSFVRQSSATYKQTTTLTGSTITLTIPVPANPNNITLYRDGQKLTFTNNDFTISGNVITLTLPTTASFFEIITRL